jgi:hypothetical protein
MVPAAAVSNVRRDRPLPLGIDLADAVGAYVCMSISLFVRGQLGGASASSV